MSYTRDITNNPWPAGMLAMLCSAIPFMGWIGLVLTGLVTFCQGPKFGLWVAACAAIPAIFFGFYFDDYSRMFASAFGGCFYTWLSAAVLYHSRSWTLVLEATLIFAMVGVIIVHLFMPDITGWWETYFHKSLQVLQTDFTNFDAASEAEFSQIIAVLNESGLIPKVARFMTGSMFALILMFNLFNLFLARWWQIVAFDSNSKIAQELTIIRLGYVTMAGFLLTIFAAWSGLGLAFDFIPIFIVIFFCAGVSLLHFFANRVKNGAIGLVIFYALMVFFPTYIIPLLLGGALLDTLVDLRQRAY